LVLHVDFAPVEGEVKKRYAAALGRGVLAIIIVIAD
jgi:hypothetical protein